MSLAPLAERLLQASLQVALLVLAVVLLERLLVTRLSLRARYGLWLVVVLRLCLPVLPESRFGLVDWGGLWSTTDPVAEAPVETRGHVAPARDPRPLAAHLEHGLTSGPDSDRRRRRPDLERRPEPAEPALGSEARAEGPPTWNTVAGPASSAAVRTPERGPVSLNWRAALVCLWALGVAAVFGVSLARELRFRRTLRGLEPLADPRLASALERAATGLGLRRGVRALELPGLRSPAVHGHLRPRLLLPPGLVAGLEREPLEQVLRHELAHVARGDLLLAALLLVLRALWWFHPLVHLALGRLHQTQEELRDQDALSSPNAPAPASYARVLVSLAGGVAEDPRPLPVPARAIPLTRGHRGLQRRIDMILSYRHPSGASRALGAALVLTVGWFGLVRAGVAAPDAGAALTDPSGSSPTDADRREVHVERQEPLPAWWSELERALTRPVELHLSDAAYFETFAMVCAQVGVNVVVDMEALMSDGNDHDVSLDVTGVSAREALDLLCSMGEDVVWGLHRESVVVSSSYALPRTLDLRFYRIAPVLESFEERDWPVEPEDIVTAVVDFACSRTDVWEEEGVSIDLWSGLLAVRVDEASHREVKALLERLLNRETRPATVPQPWRAEAERKLASTIDVDLEDMPLSDALQTLTTVTGLSLVWMDGHPDDEGLVLNLHLQDTRVSTVLDWCCELADTQWRLEDGVVKLNGAPRLELHLHPVGALLDVAEDPDEVRYGAEEFARTTIDPDSWDSDPRCCFVYLGDVALVNQTPANQERVSLLLATMKRALDE